MDVKALKSLLKLNRLAKANGCLAPAPGASKADRETEQDVQRYRRIKIYTYPKGNSSIYLRLKHERESCPSSIADALSHPRLTTSSEATQRATQGAYTIKRTTSSLGRRRKRRSSCKSASAGADNIAGSRQKAQLRCFTAVGATTAHKFVSS